MVRDDVSSVSAWSVSDDVRQVLYNEADGSLLDVSELFIRLFIVLVIMTMTSSCCSRV